MSEQKLEHDIKSDIQAILNAAELIRDEWKNNPQLVDQILPLTLDKISELQIKLAYFQIQKK